MGPQRRRKVAGSGQQIVALKRGEEASALKREFGVNNGRAQLARPVASNSQSKSFEADRRLGQRRLALAHASRKPSVTFDEAYRRLFDSELDPELLRDIRKSTHGGYALGNQRFREEIERTLNRRATPRGPGRPVGR